MSNDKKAPEKFPHKMVLPDGKPFTAFGVVSRASPPIKPLSGHGVSRAPTTHKPAVPVDWSFWPASRRVTRDEAIALSLGLDPHSLYGRTNGYINPEFCPDNATAILFLKRMNLLAACDSRKNIPLSEFAAWAVSNLPSTPPEFEAIVNATKSNETRALAVAKVTDAMMARDKPLEKVIYIIQGAAPHAPATPNATKSDGISAPAKVGADDSPIPGKLPNISVGKLAIEVAWLLEQETHRAATAQEVMKQLQAWADDGSKPEVLLKSAKAKHGVEWRTKGGKPKIYDSEACGKALATWIKSRA